MFWACFSKNCQYATSDKIVFRGFKYVFDKVLPNKFIEMHHLAKEIW
jgi:hypothetical protein